MNWPKAIRSTLISFTIIGCLSVQAESLPIALDWAQKTDVNRSPATMAFHSEVKAVAGTILEVNAVPVKGARQSATIPCNAFACIPITVSNGLSSGISFDYKGDGSPYYASVFVGKTPDLLNGYEAQFPLDSTEWRRMTLRWTDFINNSLPWDKQARLSPADMTFSPAELKTIGFGRANCNHKFFTPKFHVAIRDIRLEVTLPDNPVPAFSKQLSRTSNLIRQKKPLNILMLGDSITDFGEGKSHGWHCAQLLQKKYGLPPCKVANAGIGGQTVRFGTIILPRALRLMPNPDLVCIMYGANDCKAATGEFNQSGFNEEAFGKNLEFLIDQVRRATDGKADIVLLSGVPRLDKGRAKTTGAVEKVVGAFKTVAAQKETAFCATFPILLTLPPAQKKAFYKDTVHQTQTGLAFIGQLLFKTVDDAVTQAGAKQTGE